LLIGIIAGLALAAYTAVRFSVIMPAIALDEPIDLQSAIRATRGRAWQLWRGLLATLSPVLIIAAGLSFYVAKSGSASWAASSLQGFTVITAVPLAVVFLTLSYFRYIRKAAKPRMKVIGEPPLHVRLFYDVQRYFILSSRTVALFLKQCMPKPKAKPKPQSMRRRPVVNPASANRKDDLARKVAEKLANMEEEKLIKLAALLEDKAETVEVKKSANVNIQSSSSIKPKARPAPAAELRVPATPTARRRLIKKDDMKIISGDERP
jgi:hypothetical protein